jgi:predicted nucleic acid-binding protein
MTRYYAVIDTNVVLASLLSRHDDSATVKVMEEILNGRIIPLYHQEILEEYEDVLQ